MLRTLVSLAAAVAMLSHLAMATNFTVGGPTGGWDTTTDLQAWATSQTFSVGDNLIFQYTPNHNLLEVTKADYDSCQNSNPIRMYSGGTTPIPLVSSGTRYFICGTSGHCSQGMKVEIDTVAASTPPPPASPPLTPTRPPRASPLATPTPSPTKTPPSPLASSPPTETPTSQQLASEGPASSPTVPLTESPANSPPPSVFSPPAPPFSAAEVKLMSGSPMGFAFVMMMLLL